jgi:hypothetical protein
MNILHQRGLQEQVYFPTKGASGGGSFNGASGGGMFFHQGTTTAGIFLNQGNYRNRNNLPPGRQQEEEYFSLFLTEQTTVLWQKLADFPDSADQKLPLTKFSEIDK